MKQMVRINAENVKSKFGYIIEDCVDYALIKVACDKNECLIEDHCIVLGCTLYEKI